MHSQFARFLVILVNTSPQDLYRLYCPPDPGEQAASSCGLRRLASAAIIAHVDHITCSPTANETASTPVVPQLSTLRITCLYGVHLVAEDHSHRRSQDFVWGALFRPKKLTTFF